MHQLCWRLQLQLLLWLLTQQQLQELHRFESTLSSTCHTKFLILAKRMSDAMGKLQFCSIVKM